MFIDKLTHFNFTVYRTRLNVIMARFLSLLQNIATTRDLIHLLSEYNLLCYSIKR